MALPSELLEQLRILAAQCGDLQGIVATLTADGAFTKQEALDRLETNVNRWLEASQPVEEQLLGFVRPAEVTDGDRAPEVDEDGDADSADAVERLRVLGLIHLAAAADVGKLVGIDDLADGDPIREVDPAPERYSALQELTGDGPGEANLVASLAAPGGPAGGDDEDKDPVTYAVATSTEAVLMQLIDGAGKAARSTVVALAASPHAIFAAIKPGLDGAVGALPETIAKLARKSARSIRRLALQLLGRARDVLVSVLGGQLKTAQMLGPFLACFQPEDRLLEKVFRRATSTLFNEKQLAVVIGGELERRMQQNADETSKNLPLTSWPDYSRQRRKLLAHNKKWVENLGVWDGRVTHLLWGVPVGPVPAAPIACVLLLGWTMGFTGAQLGTGNFPRFGHPGLMQLM